MKSNKTTLEKSNCALILVVFPIAMMIIMPLFFKLLYNRALGVQFWVANGGSHGLLVR